MSDLAFTAVREIADAPMTVNDVHTSKCAADDAECGLIMEFANKRDLWVKL